METSRKPVCQETGEERRGWERWKRWKWVKANKGVEREVGGWWEWSVMNKTHACAHFTLAQELTHECEKNGLSPKPPGVAAAAAAGVNPQPYPRTNMRTTRGTPRPAASGSASVASSPVDGPPLCSFRLRPPPMADQSFLILVRTLTLRLPGLEKRKHRWTGEKGENQHHTSRGASPVREGIQPKSPRCILGWELCILKSKLDFFLKGSEVTTEGHYGAGRRECGGMSNLIV